MESGWRGGGFESRYQADAVWPCPHFPWLQGGVQGV